MTTYFEEKTYENYFNIELDRRSSIFFPLGQVQEGFLGFDSSANSRNRRLWRWLGYPFLFFPQFSGIEFREMAHMIEHNLETYIDSLPSMKANLLFQYKRPEYIKTRFGKEWKHWKAPYFRYDIYEKQQKLLTDIENRFQNRILIVYASTTARNVDELVQQKLNGSIIKSSNFTRSCDLNGHKRNTYINSGTYSIACSKPKKIENLDILLELEKLEQIETNKNISNRQFIINFRRQMSSIISENQYYGTSFQRLKDYYNNYGNNELIFSFVVLNIFKLLTGIQWLVKLQA